jgi:hypothetical protein
MFVVEPRCGLVCAYLTPTLLVMLIAQVSCMRFYTQSQSCNRHIDRYLYGLLVRIGYVRYIPTPRLCSMASLWTHVRLGYSSQGKTAMLSVSPPLPMLLVATDENYIHFGSWFSP